MLAFRWRMNQPHQHDLSRLGDITAYHSNHLGLKALRETSLALTPRRGAEQSWVQTSPEDGKHGHSRIWRWSKPLRQGVRAAPHGHDLHQRFKEGAKAAGVKSVKKAKIYRGSRDQGPVQVRHGYQVH